MIEQIEASAPLCHSPFDDGRGAFPDRIQTCAPVGMRSSIRRAAEARGISSAAFVREAIEARLRQAGAIATALGA